MPKVSSHTITYTNDVASKADHRPGRSYRDKKRPLNERPFSTT